MAISPPPPPPQKKKKKIKKKKKTFANIDQLSQVRDNRFYAK